MMSRIASRSVPLTLSVVLSCAAGLPAKADTIQLVNGDSIRGKVVSLDEKQLVFRSQSFGELKLGRDKVELIVLGDKPLPTSHQTAQSAISSAPTATGAGAGSLLSQVAPLLSSPAAQQQLGPMVEQLLGAGGLGDIQKNAENARRGLNDLKKDFGAGPESQALDAYINLLNILSPPGQNTAPKPATPPQPQRGPNGAPKKPSNQNPSAGNNPR
jgi:hypothetical protein